MLLHRILLFHGDNGGGKIWYLQYRLQKVQESFRRRASILGALKSPVVKLL